MPARYINTPEGPVRCDAAIVLPGVSGLFVHRTWIKDTTGKYWSDEWYCITHRWSGLRISDHQYSKKRDAIRVARALSQEYAIDWDIKDPTELVDSHPGLKEMIGEAVSEKTTGAVKTRKGKKGRPDTETEKVAKKKRRRRRKR